MTLPTDKVLALAREAGFSHAPRPFKHWRGQSDDNLRATKSDLTRFAAILQQQMISDGWMPPNTTIVITGL